jgi:hypothetical protein
MYTHLHSIIVDTKLITYLNRALILFEVILFTTCLREEGFLLSNLCSLPMKYQCGQLMVIHLQHKTNNKLLCMSRLPVSFIRIGGGESTDCPKNIAIQLPDIYGDTSKNYVNHPCIWFKLTHSYIWICIYWFLISNENYLCCEILSSMCFKKLVI